MRGLPRRQIHEAVSPAPPAVGDPTAEAKNNAQEDGTEALLKATNHLHATTGHRKKVLSRSSSRSSSAPAGPRGVTTAAAVAAAAEAAAVAAHAGRPWWERLHTCGRVRPSQKLPVGRRFCPPSFTQAAAPGGEKGRNSAVASSEAGAACPVVASRAPRAGFTASQHGDCDAQPRRSDTLREDSFIFEDNDDDADPVYFGVDSDEDEAFAAALNANAALNTNTPRAAPPRPFLTSHRRPASAPSTSAPRRPPECPVVPGVIPQPATVSSEWWHAESSTVAPPTGHEEWWVKDTLRRLHLEQLERLRAAGIDLASFQASPAARVAAAAMAKKGYDT